MAVKKLVRGITPPLLLDAARQLRRRLSRRPPEWEFVPEGWARDDGHVGGWDVDSVLDAYRGKLPAVRRALAGPGPIGFPTSAGLPVGRATIAQQNTVLAFAYGLTLASRHKDRISVLDWGGGLGYFYFLSRALLPGDVEIEYHCKEGPLICRYGREAVPEITFWDDDSCLAREYDFVCASSSLQYVEQWRDLVGQLARASRSHLFVTRVPVVFESASFVALQRAWAYAFETELLSWVFNRQELLDAIADCNMTLLREFLLWGRPRVAGAPEQQEIRGYLFTRT
jgi:putative methyltransferase (TIGR04325 family)